MLEKELEKKFKAAVESCGGRALKFVSPGISGVPDRLVLLPGGRVGFVELKQQGKKPRKLQELQMNRLRSMGFYVTVLDTPEDIGVIIQELTGQEVAATSKAGKAGKAGGQL